MDQIKEIINTLTSWLNIAVDILLKYGKFIIFVLCITLIIPIGFYIWLICMGFLSTGIAAGSSAALWMASLGNVQAGNENIDNNIPNFLIILLIIITFIFILISFVYGVYLGYNFPFEILK